LERYLISDPDVSKKLRELEGELEPGRKAENKKAEGERGVGRKERERRTGGERGEGRGGGSTAERIQISYDNFEKEERRKVDGRINFILRDMGSKKFTPEMGAEFGKMERSRQSISNKITVFFFFS
jgi:hypothetical protein